jgi:hypothetical protein
MYRKIRFDSNIHVHEYFRNIIHEIFSFKVERDTLRTFEYRSENWHAKNLTIFRIKLRWFYFNRFSQFLYTWRQSWPSKPVFEHYVVAYPWQLLQVSQRHRRTKYLKSYSIRRKLFFPLSWYKSYHFTPKNVKKCVYFDVQFSLNFRF